MAKTYSNNENIKQRAFDKIGSMYLASTIKRSDDAYWSIDPEQAEKLQKLDLIDIEVYNYILTLIEKDRI